MAKRESKTSKMQLVQATTLPKEITLNKYQAKFSFDYTLNRPIFKIFSDYFNILAENEKLQEEHGLKVVGFLRDNEFKENVNLSEGYGQRNVLVQFQDMTVNLLFDVFKQQNEVQFYFYMSSSKKTFVDAEAFYDKVWGHAVQASDLKGSYFSMERDEIIWDKKEIEKRDFSDIHLPKHIIEDLRMYVEAFKQKGILMRYLMAGSPGTGKTESTLVLANLLNQMGVTIIKTPVCSMIKEKVELAKLLAPAILIYDDIDLSLGSRTKGVHPEKLQDFLDVMDGTDKLGDNVGIIATTNSVDLLDLAAQRPGRFDTSLSFDDLTSENIRQIILKSLKYAFELEESSEETKLFTDAQVIKVFKESRATGANIHNRVKRFKFKMDLLNKEITLKSILEYIESNKRNDEKIYNSNYLSNKLTGGTGAKMGFGNSEGADEDVDADGTETYKMDEDLSDRRKSSGSGWTKNYD